MKVKLTYFKESGKYYSDGNYETNKIHLFEIFKEVKQKLDDRCLPGLIKNHSYFIVLIDVPEHQNNHPHLAK